MIVALVVMLIVVLIVMPLAIAGCREMKDQGIPLSRLDSPTDLRRTMSRPADQVNANRLRAKPQTELAESRAATQGARRR